ncbi:MAG TPA: metallophosphoesterase [Mucilaginibacter sp.]|jgi:hypothetical protein|nr:metallophosphoesterase [Mucilaginibacter sp.]
MKRKYFYIAALLLLFCKLPACGQQVVDGPYVSYRNEKVKVTTIEKDDDLLLPKMQVYPNRQNISLKITPEGHPEWAFSVKLRDTLINDPVSYAASPKTLFMSDIEGEFGPFRKMLLAAGVIDTAYSWTYGKNSLVIPGDLFDRGRDVVPELWLLYKLEDEARVAGGHSIIILGNHDVMNLSGDHRYTDGKYFKNAWLFGREIDDLFGKDTELGRWLRSKNTLIKTGDVLVMHGGLSPELLARKQSIAIVDAECRAYCDVETDSIPDSLQVFFGRNALFWYRGYFLRPKATMSLVDSTLQFYCSKYILVGHTIVKWNIASYYGGKIIGIDVDEHTGHTEAALYEKGKWYVLDVDGRKSSLKYKPKNDRVKEEDIL